MRKFSSCVVAVAFAGILMLGTAVFAAETTAGDLAPEKASVYQKIGLSAAAAFTIAMSVWGAAYAVSRIGSAAMGAAAEKPELLTRSLLFVALAEGLAVLGFVIAIMLVQKI
ncbi:MAG: ATP synthase subunit C [Verrucomicrobiota bacterium]|jgi:V/A-type H+/Na+-transporting ATPase subunit K